MNRAASTLIACLLLVWTAGDLRAAGRPTFGVTFDATAEYLRIARGTSHGLKNDYAGPGATTGMLLDAQDREVGSFVTVYADDFGAIVRKTIDSQPARPTPRRITWIQVLDRLFCSTRSWFSAC